MKYQIESDGTKTEVENKAGVFRFGNKELDFDFHALTQDQTVVRIENQLHRVKLLSVGEDGKTITALVNGKKAELILKSETDLLLEKMGVGHSGQLSTKKIKAPMPGLIVKVLAAAGDSVEKGQVLLNFEAMKMENQLKSPGAGKIKSALVVQGDKVEKGQLLLEFE